MAENVDLLNNQLAYWRQVQNQARPGMQIGVGNRNQSYEAGMNISDLLRRIQTAQTQNTGNSLSNSQVAASSIADMADPFRAERGQYQTQLRDLLSSGGANAMNNPFFKANADAGQEAASRKLAQLGMSNSGNAAFELQRNAMANQGDAFFKMADLLGGLSGGKADPSAAASAQLGLMNLGEKQRQFDLEFGRKNTPTFGGGFTSGGLSNGNAPFGIYSGKLSPNMAEQPYNNSMSDYWQAGY